MIHFLNYRDVTEIETMGNKTYEPLPEGSYDVEIEQVKEHDKNGVPLQTRNNDPFVKISYIVISGKYKGRRIFDQIFLFPGNVIGAGITKHFLHCIEQPYENDFEVDPFQWLGKKLIVNIVIDKKYNNNKVTKREIWDTAFNDIRPLD